jgi:hypothetical protein
MAVQYLLSALVLAGLPSSALAAVTLNSSTIDILPIKIQSKELTFNDWITLFTLCLAPLLAHILSGVPKIVYLAKNKPDWHHQLGLYNPTTILWRYFAIADRRMRAKNWNAADMSASNAYFWTPRGWDGSEAISRKSREYCVTLPETSHASILSAQSIKTLIITLQGANAIYVLIIGLFPSPAAADLSFANTASIGSIFFPLAVFGLMRLLAAFWLTEEYVYINCENGEATTIASQRSQSDGPEKIQLVQVRTPSTNDLLDMSDVWSGEDFKPSSNWKSWLFRGFFLLPIIGLIILCLYYIIPTSRSGTLSLLTATTFTLVLFYLFFLTVSAFVYGYYFIRGRNTTTVLPCVTSRWYQIYTALLGALMLILVVIASIETRKSACGYYTTWPVDYDPCSGFAVSSDLNATEGIFGLAVRGSASTTGFEFTEPNNFTSVVFFNGVCSKTGNPTGIQEIQVVGNFTPFRFTSG